MVLDYFDNTDTADQQLSSIRMALKDRISESLEDSNPISDLLVYYIGHGLTDNAGHLSLLVRRSEKGYEDETSIKAKELASVLKRAAPQQRRVVILDCCFAEAAVIDNIMMSSRDQGVAALAKKALKAEDPKKGSLLLCSSPAGEVAIAPQGARHTLFTGAVLKVLNDGVDRALPHISLAELRDFTYDEMLAQFGSSSPRPVLHQTNADYGDLTRSPAFTNKTHILRENEKQRQRELYEKLEIITSKDKEISKLTRDLTSKDGLNDKLKLDLAESSRRAINAEANSAELEKKILSLSHNVETMESKLNDALALLGEAEEFSLEQIAASQDAENRARVEAQRAEEAEGWAKSEARRADEAESRAGSEAQRADIAEAQARSEAKRAEEAEGRAKSEARRADEAENRAGSETQRADIAEAHARSEAKRAEEAEGRAKTEARRADEAENRAGSEAQRADTAEAHARSEAQRAEEAEGRAKSEARRADEATNKLLVNKYKHINPTVVAFYFIIVVSLFILESVYKANRMPAPTIDVSSEKSVAKDIAIQTENITHMPAGVIEEITVPPVAISVLDSKDNPLDDRPGDLEKKELPPRKVGNSLENNRHINLECSAIFGIISKVCAKYGVRDSFKKLNQSFKEYNKFSYLSNQDHVFNEIQQWKDDVSNNCTKLGPLVCAKDMAGYAETKMNWIKNETLHYLTTSKVIDLRVSLYAKKNHMNLRSEPNGKFIKEILSGTEITKLIGCKNADQKSYYFWCEVDVNGYIGWIASCGLEPSSNGAGASC